jgi:hypothetical protein
MCEPIVINGGVVAGQRFAGTHLSVPEHQRRTVLNYAQLRELAPDINWIPGSAGRHRTVLPGLRRSVPIADRAGSDHCAAGRARVGLPQAGHQGAGQIITALHQHGVTRLHGFGFKTLGLIAYQHLLTSADSLAWSLDARLQRAPLPGCMRHKNCANCLVTARPSSLCRLSG